MYLKKMNLDVITTSPYVPSNVLLVVRIIFALFSFGVEGTRIYLYGTDEFRYFTIFTWLGIALYFVCVISITIGCNRKKGDISSRTFSFVRLLLFLSAANSVFLDPVYWTLFFPKFQPYITSNLQLFLSIAPHSANVVMTQIEFWLTDFPFYLHDVGALLPVGVSYLGLTYLLKYVCGVPFPYPPPVLLDFQEVGAQAILPIIIIVAAGLLIGLIVYFEALFRDHVLQKHDHRLEARGPEVDGSQGV